MTSKSFVKTSNTIKFPLYEMLNKDLIDKDLTIAEKNDFMAKVKEIDQEGAELFYALIRFHEIETDDRKLHVGNFPYSGTFENLTLEFNLLKLPIILRRILYKFLKLHLERMYEDKSMDEEKNKFF